MLSTKMQDAFNRQLNEELFSSYLYMSMSAYFESANLKGMASWMRVQAQEELAHAMKFFSFIHERDGQAVLTGIEGPKTEWSSALDAFEDTYKHECKITGLINDLVESSLAEKDYAANAFLQWFVTEQVEEEASAKEVRDKLRFVGDDNVVLFMLDQELGQRTVALTPSV